MVTSPQAGDERLKTDCGGSWQATEVAGVKSGIFNDASRVSEVEISNNDNNGIGRPSREQALGAAWAPSAYSWGYEQRCFNKLHDWAHTNGFRFSSSKTVSIHFCRLRKAHLDPQLFLNGMPIPVVEKTKFLGLIFDRKLSFVPHLQHLKGKCLKAINLLHVVAHAS